MPRNAGENIYVTVAFSRDAPAWEHLQREAKNLDISVAHLIKVLLADRAAALEGQGKQLWFPRQEMKGQPVSVSPPRTEPSPVENSTSKRAAAAASAAGYWDD